MLNFLKNMTCYINGKEYNETYYMVFGCRHMMNAIKRNNKKSDIKLEKIISSEPYSSFVSKSKYKYFNFKRQILLFLLKRRMYSILKMLYKI